MGDRTTPAQVGDTVVDRKIGFGRGTVKAVREDGKCWVVFGENGYGDQLAGWFSPELLEVERSEGTPLSQEKGR